jgi:hypothetical protein
MRSTFLLLLLLSACYSPTLGSPGYYCHADDHPACPGSQQCIDGRCQDPGGPHLIGGSPDMASSGGNGGSGDMSSGGNPQPKPDLSMGGTVTQTGCKGYVACQVACGSDTTCAAGCDGNVTASGKMLFQTAVGCGQDYCLNTSRACKLDATGTMLVDAKGTGSCTACLNDTLAALSGGTCSSAACTSCQPDAATCLADTP